MENILEFLKKYSHWFLFVILEVISAVLLFQYNTYQGSLWFSTCNAVVAKVYEWESAVEQYFKLQPLNEGLMARNVELEQEVESLREQLLDAGRDTTLLEAAHDGALKDVVIIPAHVVSSTTNRQDNFITIDKGEDDGVHPDMGVVCGTGVVGIVYQAGAHYSVVIPVISAHSNISCCVAGKNYNGYLHWLGGDPEIAFVDNIPRHARFNLKSDIITSGYSSVFPRGVRIGKIIHVYNTPGGLSYRIKVRLSTDFTRLRDVCVISDRHAQERLQVLRAAEDSIRVK